MIRRISLTLILSVLLFPSMGSADIYYYVNEDGVPCFVDQPPERGDFRVHQPAQEAVLRWEDNANSGEIINQHGNSAAARMARRYSFLEIRDLISHWSSMLGVDRALIEAVVKAESEYDVSAVSRKGAQGLMQLMPATADWLGVTNPFDPTDNLRGGIRLIKRLVERYRGNLDLALAAYNAGEAAVEKYKGIPPYPETIDYVSKVRKYYTRFAQNDPFRARAYTLVPATYSP